MSSERMSDVSHDADTYLLARHELRPRTVVWFVPALVLQFAWRERLGPEPVRNPPEQDELQLVPWASATGSTATMARRAVVNCMAVGGC